MSTERKRAIIAIGRRIALTGLIILTAWLMLIGIRNAIPGDVIDMMMAQNDQAIPRDPSAWDWSISLWTGELVSDSIAERITAMVGLVVFSGLLSLCLAAVLLTVGTLIGRITNTPAWLFRIRQILRLIFISSGVSAPIFMLGTLFIVFPIIWSRWEFPVEGSWYFWWQIFFVSLLPAWLLVQVGHGELMVWSEELDHDKWQLVRHVGVRLIIRLLKIIGAIIVITIPIEMAFASRGMGRLVFEAAVTRDYPLLFGVVWFFVLVVAIVKLIADIIETAYNHFGHYTVLTESEQREETSNVRIHKGWVVFCLVLVFITILFAAVAPHFAPYGYNEIILADRMSPPSSEHIFGADNLGRDIFSRIIYGTRIDLLAPTLALIPGMAINWGFGGVVPWAVLVGVFIMLIFPFGWSLLAAYLKNMNNWLGDTLEDVLMLPRDIICAFPWFVLGLLLMSILGPGLLQVSLVIGILLVPRILAMMRETYRSPPEGKSWLYGVLWSIPIVIIFFIAGGILYTSSFSYIGFGIPPPIPELGSMLSGTGRQYMLEAPWMARMPSIFLIILMFIWVMAGDAILEKLGFRSKAVWVQAVE